VGKKYNNHWFLGQISRTILFLIKKQNFLTDREVEGDVGYIDSQSDKKITEKITRRVVATLAVIEESRLVGVGGDPDARLSRPRFGVYAAGVSDGIAQVGEDATNETNIACGFVALTQLARPARWWECFLSWVVCGPPFAPSPLATDLRLQRR
jgi:hypothetical protein